MIRPARPQVVRMPKAQCGLRRFEVLVTNLKAPGVRALVSAQRLNDRASVELLKTNLEHWSAGLA